MTKEWLDGILSGASFPDLKKAVAAKGIKALLGKVKPGESIYDPVNEKKKELEKQYRGDFRAAVASHGIAIKAGNSNSCGDKKQFASAATDQQNWANQNTRRIILPSYGARKVTPKKMPRSRGLSPVATRNNEQPQHPSIARAKFGGLNAQAPIEYKLETIKPQKL